MSNNIRKLGLKVACSVMAGGLALALGIGFAGAGEQPSAATIINTLTPKPPLTRSLSSATTPAEKAKNAEDVKFLSTLKNRTTRSLSMGERDQIATIVKDKPKIDLEINFDYNSADISAKSMPSVQALGRALTNAELKGSTFVVAGHTDAAGGEAYNQELSERRAESIKKYLVDKYGINGTDLVTVGYGKSKLKDPSQSMAEVNRRVQVVNMENKATASK